MGKREVLESVKEGEKKVPKHGLSYYEDTSSLFWDIEMLYEYFELKGKRKKPIF